jgi:uncharacterized delta-60 repeat protein
MLHRAKRGGKPAKVRRPRFQLEVETLEQRCLLNAGSLDFSFGQNGVANLPGDGAVRAIVVEGDGKLLVLDQSFAGYDVFRLNTDGSLDTTFGNQGEVSAAFGSGTVVVGLGILPDGRIVVGGGHGFQPGANNPDETQPAVFYVDVACFNSDGMVDSTFGNAGVAEVAFGGDASSPSNIIPAGFAVAPDGRMVVAATSGGALAVVRLNTDGSLDQGFGGSGVISASLGADAQAGGVAVQSDGKIIASGFGAGQFQVLRFKSDGSSDVSFGVNGAFSTALSGSGLAGSRLAFDPASGMIVVSADTLTHPYSYLIWPETHLTLWRLQADGQPDATFGTDGQLSPSQDLYSEQPSFHTLALQDDGKILVAGLQGGTAFVTRYNADGSLDLSFGNGGSLESSSAWWSGNASPWPGIALQGDGKVVLASETTTYQDLLVSQNPVVSRFDVDSDIRPTPFGSEDALRQYLIEQAVQAYSGEFGQRGWPDPYFVVPRGGAILPGVALFAANAATTNAAPSYSTTNTQVSGVDEGDTVKTDGKHLYVLANNNLVILDAWPAADLSTLSTTALQGTPVAEYLDGDRLTVIADDWQSSPASDNLPPTYNPWYESSFHPLVHVTVYDVSDPTAPVVVQQTTLDGAYTSSRAIGDTVYVAVSNSNLSLPGPQLIQLSDDSYVYETEAAYRARMEALPLDSILPHYTTQTADSKVAQSGVLTDAADIFRPALPGDNNLVSLVALDLTGTAVGPTSSVSFLTSYGATLYAAPDNFYLMTSRWSYDGMYTFIDKLSLAGGSITLTATGEVPGSIINQFAVGEDGAYLDIATTSGSWNAPTSRIYVLAQTDAALNIVGQTGELAPGEAIYSVRFLGDHAFVSTFKQMDPLFAVDLSNPTAPRIAGTLEISGYTAYLQAIDATHLIGIGEDVDPNTLQSKGLDISLFDISDLANPILLSRYEVSTSGPAWRSQFGFHMLANLDYHAITYYADSQTLTLPFTMNQSWPSWPEGELGVASAVMRPDLIVAGGTEPNWGFGRFVSHADQLVLHVDAASGTLTLDGEISDTSSIQRGVFIGSMLYSISDSSVQVHDLGDLTMLVAQVALPGASTVPPGPVQFWDPPMLPPVVIKPIYVVLPLPPVQGGSDPKTPTVPSDPIGPLVYPFVGPVAQPGSRSQAPLAEHPSPVPVIAPVPTTSTRSTEQAIAPAVGLSAAPVIVSPTIAAGSTITSAISAATQPGNQLSVVLPFLQRDSIFAPRDGRDQSVPGGSLLTGPASTANSLDLGGLAVPQEFPEANPGGFGQTSAPSSSALIVTDVFFDALGQGDAEAVIELAGW